MRHATLIARIAAALALATAVAACGTPIASTSSSEVPESSGSDAPAQSASPSSATEQSGPIRTRPDGPFTFGYIIPETGSLAFLGPPQIAALTFAISKINDAEGINGEPLQPAIAGDEGDDIGLVLGTMNRELEAGVDAIIGAAATSMSMAIIDKITYSGVAQCSGTNTGIPLTDYPGKFNGTTQLYFRTAPSDALQGPILGKLVLKDGHHNVAVVSRADSYGTGLANATAAAIEAGGGKVVLKEAYPPKSTAFGDVVQKIKAANPDAIVTASFDEGFKLWQELFDAGLTTKTVGFYGADGMRSTDAPQQFSNPSVLDGASGTAPTSVDNPEFISALKSFSPGLTETQFATQVFDCATIFALAAEQAHTNDPMTWAPLVPGITKDGVECTTYADCKALVAAGTDIHYVGASGDLAFTKNGEPGIAHIEVWRYENGGQLVSDGVQQSSAD